MTHCEDLRRIAELSLGENNRPDMQAGEATAGLFGLDAGLLRIGNRDGLCLRPNHRDGFDFDECPRACQATTNG